MWIEAHPPPRGGKEQLQNMPPRLGCDFRAATSSWNWKQTFSQFRSLLGPQNQKLVKRRAEWLNSARIRIVSVPQNSSPPRKNYQRSEEAPRASLRGWLSKTGQNVANQKSSSNEYQARSKKKLETPATHNHIFRVRIKTCCLLEDEFFGSPVQPHRMLWLFGFKNRKVFNPQRVKNLL